MNSLMNYGSDDDDDDYEETANEGKLDCRAPNDGSHKNHEKSATTTAKDANYDEVQMDLSEESNESTKDNNNTSRSKDSDRRRRESSGNKRDRNYRHHSSRHERRRERRRSPRRSRSRSRDRRKSSSSSSKRHYEKSAANTKSIERKEEKPAAPPTPTAAPAPPPVQKPQPSSEDRFFMPGITGRFREQIERRKQLWQKKKEQLPQQAVQSVVKPNGQQTGVWETTTFAQDTDGKVANKFKRLMGIRDGSGGGNSASNSTQSSGNVLKKQEEMFNSMEAQYEVARTATHTMRGVGLGFGSYQR